MSDELPIGPNRCVTCGGEYGEHEKDCSELAPATCCPAGSESEDCPLCHGSGEDWGHICSWDGPVRCSHCSGTGQIERRQPQDNDKAQRPPTNDV